MVSTIGTRYVPRIGEKVGPEMTRLLYRPAGFGLFLNFVLALIPVAGTFDYHPHSVHRAWLTTIFVVSLARFALNLAFVRRMPSQQELPRWRLAFILGVTFAGLVWGAAGWLYFERPALMPQLLLMVILTGLNAGGARSLAAVPISYCIYVTATLAPLLFRAAASGEPSVEMMALVIITYALFLINTAKLNHGDLWRLWNLPRRKTRHW